MKGHLFLCLILVCVAMSQQTKSYANYKVVRVVPTTNKQLKALQDLHMRQVGHEDYDFWLTPGRLGAPVDISLSPDTFNTRVDELKNLGLHPNVTISNVGKTAYLQQLPSMNEQYDPDNHRSTFNYSVYHKLREIENWMRYLSIVHRDKVSLVPVAMSYEGRIIKALKISTPGDKPKRAFWMEGGIHAREWVSPATVIFMTGQMLDMYDRDQEVRELVDMFDWYVLPVFNVDGYKYTWEKDRLWRKTRSKQTQDCYGVDPNRNWGYQWCVAGAAKVPCTETYCGKNPFSEVEVKGVSNFLNRIPNLVAFIDFHSYSQMWLTSWGYTDNLPKDYLEMDHAAKIGVTALAEKYGTKYAYGSIANIIYVAAGGSTDWVYFTRNVKYSAAPELRDTGEYGFLLPANQIIPSGIETFDALKAFAKYVYKKT